MILSFVGKGGVGKTSVATAVALELSNVGNTTLVSTDFMPSLKYLLTDRDPIEFVELSENEVASKWIQKYGDEVYSIVTEFMDTDRSILDHIASAPGVAEEFMISNLVDMDESGKYDYVVWDTPASSSTMHLLNLEMDFYNHINRDIQFYLKLKQKFGGKKAVQTLNEWRALADHVWSELSKAHFFLVTTQDDLSVIQAEEIKKDFLRMGLTINMTICNRFRDEQPRNVECGIRIPECSGDGREIVDIIRQHISGDFLSKISRKR